MKIKKPSRSQAQNTHVYYNPIDLILPRLEKVRQAGKGKWTACCPAHDDKNPSMSVRECSDGKVLVYCHALQCSFKDIVEAIGLEERHLFPQPALTGHRPIHKRLGPRKRQELKQEWLFHYYRIADGLATDARGELTQHDRDQIADSVEQLQKLEGLLDG